MEDIIGIIVLIVIMLLCLASQPSKKEISHMIKKYEKEAGWKWRPRDL